VSLPIPLLEVELTPNQRPYLGFVAASAGCLDEVIKQQPIEPFKDATIINGTVE
jgi:hypothetical protein